MRISVRALAPLLVLALAATASIAFAVGHGSAAKEPIVREALAASAHPRGAKHRTLALSRVTIKPGASLPLHHHQGTQVSYIDKGTLTYSVEQGEVKVREGAFDDHPRVVRRIKAGQTARVRAGQWLIEQPSDFHHAANQGNERIVIYLSTLLKTGAPPSAPVGR